MDVSREHIEIVEGAFGPKPRIRGSRIRVEDIMGWHEKQGMSATQIVTDFPQLTHADVYAALAYYWDHKDEMDRMIAEGDAWVEEYRKTVVGPLDEKLKQQHVG